MGNQKVSTTTTTTTTAMKTKRGISTYHFKIKSHNAYTGAIVAILEYVQQANGATYQSKQSMKHKQKAFITLLK